MLDLSRLKVCFLAGTLGQGGAERQLFYILRALRDCGADLRLLTLGKGEFWEDRIRELGVPIVWVGQPRSRFRRLLRIITELRDDPPHILQSQHFYTNLYAVAAARRLRLREAGAIRSDCISELNAHPWWRGRLSLHSPRVLVANSRNGIRNAVALGIPSSRIHLVRNVVDTDHFRPRDGSDHQHPPLAVHIAAIGRLVVAKRPDRFIRLLATVRRESPIPVVASVVGRGPLLDDLKRQAADLDLAPEVIDFRGGVKDVAKIYSEVDILVLTSDWEGSPNVVLEAMSSGIPVVSTRVGGVPDLVQHRVTGLLVESDDERALADAVLTFIAEPELRRELAANARRFVEQHHSLGCLPTVLGEVYEAAFQNLPLDRVSSREPSPR